MLRLSAVGDLRRLWQAGPGRRAPASGPWMRRAEDLAMAFMGGGFGRCFVGIEVYERYNFIRSAIPTSIWAVWVPKAALEPETLRDYEDWPRRVLPEDTRLADLEGPDILFSLPRDDQHRLLDVVNVERRASDRHLQSNGFAAGEVDQPPRNEVWWHQYVPWIGTIIFVIGTILVVMFRNSGGG